MANKYDKNFVPEDLTELEWEPEKASESLSAIYQHVKGRVRSAISWYQGKSRWKKRGAIFLRLAAILLALAAGVIPILAEIQPDFGAKTFSPAWASVALAIAATLVFIDRLLGQSSAWMRYFMAELKLHRLYQEFQIDWEATKAAFKDQRPDTKEVQDMLSKARDFVSQSLQIVEDETNAWIVEFKSTLKVIEQAAKPKTT